MSQKIYNTDDFITLFYGLVLRRSFIHSPVHHQLTITRLTCTWPTAGPTHPMRRLWRIRLC